MLLLFALAACGGRALLDQDDASAGGPGAAGAPGGKASGPSANAGASNATDAACSQYCGAQLVHVCGFEADDQCMPSCSKELGRQTLDCQSNAKLMIACIVAAYQSGPDCNQAEQFARDKCATSITNYQACSRGEPDPPPTAEPAPSTPTPPSPRPPPIPADCSATGSGNALGCSQSMKCGARSYYDIHCKQNADGSSTCGCGADSFVLVESVVSACKDGIWRCPQ